MNDSDLPTIIDAIAFAAERHRGQPRGKASDKTCLEHVIGVVQILVEADVRDPDVLAAAVLHDTVEDGVASPDEIERRFGSRVAESVLEVSDDKAQPRDTRRRLQVDTAGSLSPAARMIRVADKIDNLRDIAAAPPAQGTEAVADRLGYTDWARDVWSRIRGGNSRLDALFLDVLARARYACRTQDNP